MEETSKSYKKGKIKEKLKEKFTRKDAKKTRRIPMAKKLKALKLYFFIVHKNRKLNLSFYLVIQRKDVACLIYNIKTCNFNLVVIRNSMFEI